MAGFSVSGFLARRTHQRWALLLPLAALLLLVEVPFQWEEGHLRTDQRRVEAFCEAYRHGHGTLPAPDLVPETGAFGVFAPTYHYQLQDDGRSYALTWMRLLYYHSTVVYASANRCWWATD